MTMTPLVRNLLIAGGIGVAATAGFMFFKSQSDKKKEAEAANADPNAAPGGGATPTAGTPTGDAGALPQGTQATPGTPGTPGAQQPQGAGLQGQQVGPYTVVPNPQSGQNIVFETATRQPVGVLDAQGNILPLESLQQQPQTQPQAQPQTGGMPQGTATAGVPQAQAGQAQYQQLAKQLFANAGNPAVGSATSSGMAGVANVAPATNFNAGAATGGTGLGTAAPQGVRGQVTSTQSGEFTILDDGSGMKVVMETASQKPVAVMDAAGNVTPITVDAAGNVSIVGAPAGTGGAGVAGAATGASTAPGAGAFAPAATTGAATGATTLTAPAATVTAPTAFTAPVGAGAGFGQ